MFAWATCDSAATSRSVVFCFTELFQPTTAFQIIVSNQQAYTLSAISEKPGTCTSVAHA